MPNTININYPLRMKSCHVMWAEASHNMYEATTNAKTAKFRTIFVLVLDVFFIFIPFSVVRVVVSSIFMRAFVNFICCHFKWRATVCVCVEIMATRVICTLCILVALVVLFISLVAFFIRLFPPAPMQRAGNAAILVPCDSSRPIEINCDVFQFHPNKLNRTLNVCRPARASGYDNNNIQLPLNFHAFQIH